MVRSPPLGQVQAQAQAPPEGPWRPCSPSFSLMAMMMMVVVVMATAVVVLAVFVVAAAAAEVKEEEVVVGLDGVSFEKKESGSGDDVVVMSPSFRQSSQKLTVAALDSRRIRSAGLSATDTRLRLRLRLRSWLWLLLLLLWHLHGPRR